MKKKKRKRFIWNSTINNNSLGSGKKYLIPDYPNQEKRGKISSFNVKVKRRSKLDYRGNPVYDINVYDTKTGNTGYVRSNGFTAGLSDAIKKTGVQIRYKKRR